MGRSAHGLCGVKFGILDLEPPESGNQEEEDDDRAVLKYGNAPGGESGVVAEGRFIGDAWFGDRIGGRQDHNR